MEMALNSIPNLSLHQRIRDDDQVDQLHNYVTVYLLILSGLILGVKELAGEPLDCWVTMEKSKHFMLHANSYCWANDLYHYPNASNLSQMPYSLEGEYDPQAGEDNKLNSYKWVTILFILQAVFFKLPDVLWSECNAHSGTMVEQLVTMLKEVTFKEPKQRKIDYNIVSEFFETWIKLNGRKEDLTTDDDNELARCFKYNKNNCFLSTMYLVVKICYLLNVIMQFVTLSVFLGFDFFTYGRHVEAASQKYFPTAALCHLKVKGASEWVQCILTMNMLMEKIFLVEWVWFLTLLGITVLNIMTWVPRIFRQETGFRFVTRYLRVLCKEADNRKDGKGTAHHFVRQYLGQDGVFILRIVAINTSSVSMAEFMRCLWNRYQEDQTAFRRLPSVSMERPRRKKMSIGGNDIELQYVPVDSDTDGTL